MKIRRIVAGFAVGSRSGATLAAVAALAALHDAELEALFAESDELSRLAALPFARELGFPSAASRRLDPELVGVSLRARAREARRALAATTGRTDPRWSFRVSRGPLVDALLAASPEADLLVVGNRPWDPAALQLARAVSATLLVLPGGATVCGPLAAICSGTVTPERAVSVLCALAAAIGDGLSILLLGDDAGEGHHWSEAAGALLREQGRDASIRFLHRDDRLALCSLLERMGPGVLALVGAESAIGEEAVAALLGTSRRPVFVCPA